MPSFWHVLRLVSASRNSARQGETAEKALFSMEEKKNPAELWVLRGWYFGGSGEIRTHERG